MVDVYRVKGSFYDGMKDQVFTIDVAEPKPEKAKERILKQIGSKHGAKRNLIKIVSIEKIATKDSKSLLIRQLGGA